MTLTTEDLEAIRTIIREELVRGPGPIEEVGISPTERAAREAEAAANAAAAAEAARWSAMTPAELATEESKARVQRWRDANTDLVARGVDPTAVLADLEAGMTADEVARAKRP